MSDSKKKSVDAAAKAKHNDDYYDNDIDLEDEDEYDDEDGSSDVDFILNDDANNLLSGINNNNNSLNNILNQRSSAHDMDEEFKYEVLTPDKIVQHMIGCIKEVNQVVEVCFLKKKFSRIIF